MAGWKGKGMVWRSVFESVGQMDFSTATTKVDGMVAVLVVRLESMKDFLRAARMVEQWVNWKACGLVVWWDAGEVDGLVVMMVAQWVASMAGKMVDFLADPWDVWMDAKWVAHVDERLVEEMAAQ